MGVSGGLDRNTSVTLLRARDGASSSGDTGPADDDLDLPARVGHRIGRYVVLDELGRGGMGVVYLAYDPELDRRVALKLMQIASGRSGDAVEPRLRREARALASVSHPNVVAVHDVGRDAAGLFIAMELVAGTDLHAWHEAHPRPTWREVLRRMLPAGRGLAAAHAAGLVHRDFKPGNVLLGRDSIKVADFGLARAVAQQSDATGASTASNVGSGTSAPVTEHGAVIGTPAYMAPEQRLGRDVDARADQYSYCVVLFELLCANRPSGTGDAETLRDAGVPRFIRAAVLRGLQPDPAQRFESLGALLHVLTRGSWARRMAPASIGVVLTVGAVSVGHAFGQSPRCDPEDAVGAWWNDARAARVETALAGVPRAGAGPIAARVRARLDAHGRAWADAWTSACVATGVRGDASSQRLDRRMACLERSAAQADALLVALEQPNAEALERAIDAAAGLGDPARCLDTDATWLDVPDDPAALAALDRARAHRQLGAWSEARAEAASVADAAAPHSSLRAAALVELGRIDGALGNAAVSSETLRGAVMTAEAAADDATKLEALTLLIERVGYHEAKPMQGRAWAAQARATAHRLGDRPRDEASIEAGLGLVERAAGRLDTAAAHLENALRLVGDEDEVRRAAVLARLGFVETRRGAFDRAEAVLRENLALCEQIYGPDHADVTNALLRLGHLEAARGQPAAALDVLGQARIKCDAAPEPSAVCLDVDMTRASTLLRSGAQDEALGIYRDVLATTIARYGESHPRVAVGHGNLGAALEQLGRVEDALAEHRRSLAIFESLAEVDPADVAQARHNVGTTLAKLGRDDEALPILERALAERETALGPDHHHLAYSTEALALALFKLGRPAEALPHLLRTRALVVDAWGADHVEVKELDFRRAQVLWAIPERRSEAVPLARRVHDALAALPAAPPELVANLEAWLADHRQ